MTWLSSLRKQKEWLKAILRKKKGGKLGPPHYACVSTFHAMAPVSTPLWYVFHLIYIFLFLKHYIKFSVSEKKLCLQIFIENANPR